MPAFTEDACVETLEEVDLLIWERCHAYMHTYGRAAHDTLENARSLANESYMIAYHRWDPSSTMSFSSYVRQVVWHRFLEIARKEAKHATRMSYIDTTEIDTEQQDRSHAWSSRETSWDVELIVELVSHSTELRERMSHNTNKKRRRMIALHLRQTFQWKWDRIANAFSELKEVLSA